MTARDFPLSDDNGFEKAGGLPPLIVNGLPSKTRPTRRVLCFLPSEKPTT